MNTETQKKQTGSRRQGFKSAAYQLTQEEQWTKDLIIRRTALSALEKIAFLFVDRILAEENLLRTQNGHETLGEKEVRMAVRVCVGDDCSQPALATAILQHMEEVEKIASAEVNKKLGHRRSKDEWPTATRTYVVRKLAKLTTRRVSRAADIRNAAAVDYILRLAIARAGEQAAHVKSKTLTGRHVVLAIKADVALNALFEHTVGDRMGKVGAIPLHELEALLYEETGEKDA